MKSIVTLTLIFITFCAFAQKQTYEFVTYTPPAGWKKEVKQNTYTSFTSTNSQNNSYCQIYIMLSTSSKGGIDADFESEWQSLVVKNYGVTEAPKMTETSSENGWTAKAGVSNFSFNNATSMAILTTMSGYNKAVSIVALTNNQDYMTEIQKFLESVEMKKQVTTNQVNNTNSNNNSNQTNNKPVVNSKYAFTTTNFDDGWTSTVQEDWVEVKKGNIKVLVHYPNKQADEYNSVLKDGDYAAWNVLVAPRYSNLKNLEWKSIQSWESVTFMEGDATEKTSGKTVHIVLFKKHYSGGGGSYLEFVTSSKSAFESEFGAYHNETSEWDKTANMQFRNKFAVAASDFPGKWSNNFAGSTYYSNIYTGASAGMSTYASSQQFEFAANTYNWSIAVADSYGGSTKFDNAKSSGTYKVLNNWQIYFSDIEKKPKTYNAYFSCIKGARLLWLQDTGYGDYTSYGRVE